MHQRIAGVASHDDRHDHHEHRDAVHRDAPRQAFAAERMQAGDQQPRKHAAASVYVLSITAAIVGVLVFAHALGFI